MPDRRAISAELNRQILIESGHRCAVCGESTPLQRAHIIPWRTTKQHNVEDLICLCANCHTRADTEHWGTKALRKYKRKPWVMRQKNPEAYRDPSLDMRSTFTVMLIVIATGFIIDICNGRFGSQTASVIGMICGCTLVYALYRIEQSPVSQTVPRVGKRALMPTFSWWRLGATVAKFAGIQICFSLAGIIVLVLVCFLNNVDANLPFESFLVTLASKTNFLAYYLVCLCLSNFVGGLIAAKPNITFGRLYAAIAALAFTLFSEGVNLIFSLVVLRIHPAQVFSEVGTVLLIHCVGLVFLSYVGASLRSNYRSRPKTITWFTGARGIAVASATAAIVIASPLFKIASAKRSEDRFFSILASMVPHSYGPYDLYLNQHKVTNGAIVKLADIEKMHFYVTSNTNIPEDNLTVFVSWPAQITNVLATGWNTTQQFDNAILKIRGRTTKAGATYNRSNIVTTSIGGNPGWATGFTAPEITWNAAISNWNALRVPIGTATQGGTSGRAQMRIIMAPEKSYRQIVELYLSRD